jgi:hypothetical protein
MPSTELGRLELQAAMAVLSEAESMNGDELHFARKAWGSVNRTWPHCSTWPRRRLSVGDRRGSD